MLGVLRRLRLSWQHAQLLAAKQAVASVLAAHQDSFGGKSCNCYAFALQDSRLNHGSHNNACRLVMR